MTRKEIKRDVFTCNGGRESVSVIIEKTVIDTYQFKFITIQENGLLIDDTLFYEEVFFKRSENSFEDLKKAKSKMYSIMNKARKFYE